MVSLILAIALFMVAISFFGAGVREIQGGNSPTSE